MEGNQPLPRVRKRDLLVQDLAGETLIYDLKTHQAHCMNETAEMVWRHCDGRTTMAEMCGVLEDRYRSPAAEETILYVLAKFDKANLLEKEGRGKIEFGLTRRELIRKVGLGAAILIPVVISVVAPEAAQAISCVPEGGLCDKKDDCCPPLNCTANQGFKRCVKN